MHKRLKVLPVPLAVLLGACGGSALHQAIQNNDMVRFRAGLAQGADVEKVYRKDSPLLLAAWLGHLDMVRLLLDAGADPNAARNDKRIAPLHAAAHAGRLDVVDLLVSRGAHLGARNINGHTALHLAVIQGHRDVVERLLDLGGQIDARANGQVTPLHEAAFAGRREIVELLLARGADPKAVSAAGKTAEDLARERQHPRVAALLESVRTGDRRAFEQASEVGSAAAFEKYLNEHANGYYAAQAESIAAERRFRESLPDPEVVAPGTVPPETCLVDYETLIGLATGARNASIAVTEDENGTAVASIGPWINLCRNRAVMVKTCWIAPNGTPVRHEARVGPLELVNLLTPARVAVDPRGQMQVEVAQLGMSLCFPDQSCDHPPCKRIAELPMRPW